MYGDSEDVLADVPERKGFSDEEDSDCKPIELQEIDLTPIKSIDP